MIEDEHLSFSQVYLEKIPQYSLGSSFWSEPIIISNSHLIAFMGALFLFCFAIISSDQSTLAYSGNNYGDSRNVLDTRLKVILENVRLNYLLEREKGGWDANLNWEDILSLGEQQRLGMVCKCSP